MSLRLRVFIVFFVLIAASLLLTITLVHRSVEGEGRSRIEDALTVGERVFMDKLKTDLASLHRKTTLISNDEALRQAVFDDPASLQVSLANYLARLSERSRSHFMWLMDIDGRIVSSVGKSPQVEIFPFGSMISDAEKNGWAASSIAPIAGELYELTMVGFFVPARAPSPSFWLVSGGKYDQASVEKLSVLTGLELVLIDDAHSLPLLYSTQDKPDLNQINSSASGFIGKRLVLDGVEEAPSSALLLKSSKDIQEQLSKLSAQLFGFGFLVLVISAVVTAYLSRSITRPLLQFVEAVKAVGKGEYRSFEFKGQSSEITSLASAFSSMQKNISERERHIEYLAFHDELTGLSNRNGFVAAVDTFIQENPDNSCVVCVMDFDRFKDINDTLGHENGDLVIHEFAVRLKRIKSEEIDIARLGGDEFAILVRAEKDLDWVLSVIKVLGSEPIDIEGIALRVNTSIGISRFGEHGSSANNLLQTSEIAMYLAKKEQKAYVFYDESLDEHSMQRLSLIAELKEAVDSGQLELHYQPKLDLVKNKYTSVESLVRWIHPRFGFIPPDEFIGYAEQTGVIKYLTRWVIETALAQARSWRDSGYDIRVAVNISAIDLGDRDFPVYVLKYLEDYQLPASSLTLEITESAVMRDVNQAMSTLQFLSDKGLRLSIDDYGQGYSSMAQLKRMPVEELKIDKAFVLNLTQDSDDFSIVKSTVELAHNMGLQVVAEGVENVESLEILSDLSCEYAQGFHLSRPLNIEKFAEWIENNRDNLVVAGQAGPVLAAK